VAEYYVLCRSISNAATLVAAIYLDTPIFWDSDSLEAVFGFSELSTHGSIRHLTMVDFEVEYQIADYFAVR
jgi:hypothetical protein